MSETPNKENNPGEQPDAHIKPHTDYGRQQDHQPPPFPAYTPPPPPYNLNPYDPAWIPTRISGSSAPLPPSNQPPHEVPERQPSPPSTEQNKKRLKILLISVATLIILGLAGSGIFAYLATRPQPFISVNSQYEADMTPAGSNGTDFRVSGHRFSSNSSVIFLLDNNGVPGNEAAQSDKDGNVITTLTVTKDWPLGDHVLTARDASGDTTKDGMALKIVPQGQAHTPGPNGAPPDDTSFTINATYLQQEAYQITLQVSGHPDPNGGSVCRPGDNGSQLTDNGQDNTGTSYTDTYTFACTGTYKGGKLTYTETLTSDKFTYTNGTTCTEHTPYTWIHLEGTFNNTTSISGSYSRDSNNYDCTQGASLSYAAVQSTWTGQVATTQEQTDRHYFSGSAQQNQDSLK